MIGATPAAPAVASLQLVPELELLADGPAGLPANGAGKPDEQLLTVQEVADRFGLSTDWLYRHWKAVGGVKLGRKVLRFPASALPRYLAARRKAP